MTQSGFVLWGGEVISVASGILTHELKDRAVRDWHTLGAWPAQQFCRQLACDFVGKGVMGRTVFL